MPSGTVTADAACAEAVDLARAAAVEVAGEDAVGDHVGFDPEDERVGTHRFAALAAAYVGWEWSVTVARASRSRTVTVDEVCLLPGSDALLAPAWVPYLERLRPGDLGPGDLLPVPADDDRLDPGWTGGAEALADDGEPDAQVSELAHELGLTRARVLSLIGMDDAADRWLNGAGGPHTALAESAPGECVSCGFLVRLGGLLGHAFGVCANEHSPSDGHVVTFDHGCGAHSETGAVASLAAASPPVLDSVGFDDLGGVVDESPQTLVADAVDGPSEVDAYDEPDVVVLHLPAGDDDVVAGDDVDTADPVDVELDLDTDDDLGALLDGDVDIDEPDTAEPDTAEPTDDSLGHG